MQFELSKTVNDGGRSKTLVLGCSEVIFRDAENVGQAALAPENLAPLPSGGNPLPMVADCEKPI